MQPSQELVAEFVRGSYFPQKASAKTQALMLHVVNEHECNYECAKPCEYENCDRLRRGMAHFTGKCGEITLEKHICSYCTLIRAFVLQKPLDDAVKACARLLKLEQSLLVYGRMPHSEENDIKMREFSAEIVLIRGNPEFFKACTDIRKTYDKLSQPVA